MRPTGVTILAIFYALGGIFGIVGGALNLNILLIALGILNFAIAYGLWKGQNWSRILVIILCILGILSGIVLVAIGPTIISMLKIMTTEIGMFTETISTVFIASGIINIIVNAMIIYYLTRPHVREFFT